MADSTNNLENEPEIIAERAARKEREAQFERDLAKIPVLDQADLDDLKIILQKVMDELAKSAASRGTLLESLNDVTPGLFPPPPESSVNAAQPVLPAAAQGTPVESPNDAAPRLFLSPQESDSNAAQPAQPPTRINRPALPPQTDGTLTPIDGTLNPASLQPPWQPAESAGPQSPEAFTRLMAGQAQALQNSDERLRAVLEQNTFITSSLFNRVLELLDGQNRKFGEVDRKLFELNNQIKSLKNP